MEVKDIQKMIADALAESQKSNEKANAEAIKLALDTQKLEFEKTFNEKNKQIEEKLSERELKFAVRDVESFVAKPSVIERIPAVQRENLKSILLGTKGVVTEGKITFSRTNEKKEVVKEQVLLGDAIQEWVESLPKYVKLSKDFEGAGSGTAQGEIVIQDGDENVIQGRNNDEKRLKLVEKIALEKGYNLKTREGLEKAENEAIQFCLKHKLNIFDDEFEGVLS